MRGGDISCRSLTTHFQFPSLRIEDWGLRRNSKPIEIVATEFVCEWNKRETKRKAGSVEPNKDSYSGSISPSHLSPESQFSAVFPATRPREPPSRFKYLTAVNRLPLAKKQTKQKKRKSKKIKENQRNAEGNLRADQLHLIGIGPFWLPAKKHMSLFLSIVCHRLSAGQSIGNCFC